ncbi:MAG: guanylate kinase [Cyclobacteriaceae bacterium]|nr:guanylate kinase [Cyclobacteriaceae bacterium]
MASKKAVIISAPSGSGKTTIVKFLLDQIPELQFSISATSRDPRKNESNGKDYYFLSKEDFRERIRNDEFIEWEEVYEGIYYGTLKSEIERIWSLNQYVIFDVDVRGGVNLKNYFTGTGLSIFLMVRNMDELEKRLRGRMTESEKSIRFRLAKARNEMQYKKKFDHIVINDDIEQTRKEISDLVSIFLKS